MRVPRLDQPLATKAAQRTEALEATNHPKSRSILRLSNVTFAQNGSLELTTYVRTCGHIPMSVRSSAPSVVKRSLASTTESGTKAFIRERRSSSAKESFRMPTGRRPARGAAEGVSHERMHWAATSGVKPVAHASSLSWMKKLVIGGRTRSNSRAPI